MHTTETGGKNFDDAGRRYLVTWTETPEPAPELNGRWLVLGPATGSVDAIVSAWPRDQLVLLDVATDAFDRRSLAERLADQVRVTPDLRGIVSLLALEPGPHPEFPAVPCGFAATLTVLQAQHDAGLDLPLWCVTQTAVSVEEAEAPDPTQASIWGLGQVATLEFPDSWGGLVDLPAEVDDQVVDRLLALLAQSDGEQELALRAAAGYVRRLRRTPCPSADWEERWQPRGAALVTGGTSGTGAQIARWLAAHGTEHLVLTSRRGPEAPDVDGLRTELEASGATVSVAAVDVGDREALVRLIRDEQGNGAEFRTVVHAAGVPQLALIADMSLEECAEIMNAKLGGASLLDEVFSDASLDAFVLFSSIYAVWGGPMSGAYAAGNAYLDALAQRRRHCGLAATSLAWGPLGSGMLAQAPAEVREALRAQGFSVLPGSEAVAECVHAVQEGLTTVTVVDVDWNRFLTGGGRPLFEHVTESNSLAC